jgi:hypothetical protein
MGGATQGPRQFNGLVRQTEKKRFSSSSSSGGRVDNKNRPAAQEPEMLKLK